MEKEKVLGVQRNCPDKLGIIFSTLLYNAMNPLKPVRIFDKSLKNPYLDRLGHFFGDIPSIKCPTYLLGKRIVNFLISPLQNYEYLKNYLKGR